MILKSRLTTLILILLTCLSAFSQSSQQAKIVLDKISKTINKNVGFTAQYTAIGKGIGRSSGAIFVKVNKVKRVTPQMTLWSDGKTTWTYVKSIKEVNISYAKSANIQDLNPYALLGLYKTGYILSLKNNKTGYTVYIKSNKKTNKIKQAIISTNKIYKPTIIKVLNGNYWTIIYIRNIKTTKLNDNIFHFNKSKAPGAEIVDLR